MFGFERVYFLLVIMPAAITLLIALSGGAVTFILSKTKKENNIVGIAFGAGLAIGLIATVTCIAVYYSSYISGDGYYTDESAGFNGAALYISALLLVAAIVAAAFILDREKLSFDAKCLARAGVCIALSFVLSFIKLFKMPQGGTITLAAALPIMLFSYAYGAKKGVLVGLIYGLIQSVQDAYIIHPAQFLLDYPIAFTMYGFVGLMKKTDLSVQAKFVFGAAVATVLRFMSHLLSGVFAFGAYAVEAGASNFFIYSAAYNSFVFVDLAIALAVGVALLFSKSFVKIIGIEE